jgi:hypothetical protein
MMPEIEPDAGVWEDAAAAGSKNTHSSRPANTVACLLDSMGDIIAPMSGRFGLVSRWSVGLVVVAALIVAFLMSPRRVKEPPIRVDGPTLIVENQTPQEWRHVTVTVNAYYRGQTASLAPGGRIETRLGTLMTGLGQYFNPARESVRTVQVRATDAQGQAVALDWSDTQGK